MHTITKMCMSTDKTIIKNLNLALVKKVWEKCVLLFTFSDHAYEEFDTLIEHKKHKKSCK